jgi:putative ATP-binding cassette transporter
VLTVVSGAANAALVGFINYGADAVYRGEDTTWAFVMFLACLLLFVVSKMRAETAGKRLFDDAMTRQRERLMDKLLAIRLDAMEQMRRSDVISTSARSIGQVIQASDTIVYGLQSMFMLVFCAVYLAYVSFAAFLAVAGALVFAALYRQSQQGESKKQMLAFSTNDKELSNLVSESLSGFKEIKINAKRRAALRADYARLVELSSVLSLRATKEIVQMRVIIQSVFFCVIAIVVFVIPKMTNVYALEVLEITAIVLFLIGYLAGFLDIFPVLSRTNSALQDLEELEEKLDAQKEQLSPNAEHGNGFEGLELRGVEFTYYDPDRSQGFRLGPIDLAVVNAEVKFPRRAEVIFPTFGIW